jgi:hypothetical protein
MKKIITSEKKLKNYRIIIEKKKEEKKCENKREKRV